MAILVMSAFYLNNDLYKLHNVFQMECFYKFYQKNCSTIMQRQILLWSSLSWDSKKLRNISQYNNTFMNINYSPQLVNFWWSNFQELIHLIAMQSVKRSCDLSEAHISNMFSVHRETSYTRTMERMTKKNKASYWTKILKKNTWLNH